jgi:3-hydroxyisobutyrate dehydrogenase-like beta-hydroxyacid dehydrogenase
MNETIGFVGVGRMGANMARRGSTIAWFVSPCDKVNQAMAEPFSGKPERLEFDPVVSGCFYAHRN